MLSNAQVFMRDFKSLERRSGIEIAVDPFDYIRHLQPNQLAEFTSELFGIITTAVAVPAQEDIQITCADVESDHDFQPECLSISIEVTTPTLRNGDALPVVETEPLSSSSFETEDTDNEEQVQHILDYTIHSEIAVGLNGPIVEVRSYGVPLPLAGKVLSRGKIFGDAHQNINSTDRELYLREKLASMKKLQHKNVMPLVAAIQDPAKDTFYLIFPQLMHRLIHLNDSLQCPIMEPHKVGIYLRQLVNGVSYLEKQNIVHGRIHPGNVLLSTDDIPVLCDVGVSQLFVESPPMGMPLPGSATWKSSSSNSPHRVRGDIMPSQHMHPAFIAPELLLDDGVPVEMTTAVDVWSLGVLLFCMLFGRLPFQGRNWGSTVASMLSDKELNIPETIEPSWIDVLQGMLSRDPQDRISLSALRRHPVLRERSESFGRGGSLSPLQRSSESIGHPRRETITPEDLVHAMSTVNVDAPNSQEVPLTCFAMQKPPPSVYVAPPDTDESPTSQLLTPPNPRHRATLPFDS